MLRYRVIELGLVTSEEIEAAVNREVKDGWALDGIHFAMRESSKRPSMAFIFFKKDSPE
ncbi:MAG: DUF4177 domain-containing protein [Deltaproteobacteria bacterium]|nr:DUF4177 domain-containing protein [Deltaproteobacteria bacterium]